MWFIGFFNILFRFVPATKKYDMVMFFVSNIDIFQKFFVLTAGFLFISKVIMAISAYSILTKK